MTWLAPPRLGTLPDVGLLLHHKFPPLDLLSIVAFHLGHKIEKKGLRAVYPSAQLSWDLLSRVKFSDEIIFESYELATTDWETGLLEYFITW